MSTILNSTNKEQISNCEGNNHSTLIKKWNNEFLYSIKGNAKNGYRSNCEFPYETHPYLEYRKLFPKNPNGYMIGTFPPASYLRSIKLPSGNSVGESRFKVNEVDVKPRPKIDFFHGNQLSFWESVGVSEESIDGISEESIDGIVKYLTQMNWAYSDIISGCRRIKIDSTSDNDLVDIVLNEGLLNEILSREDSPKLWFNTSGVFNKSGIQVNRYGLVNIKGRQSYNLFLHGLQQKGYALSVRRSDNENWMDINRSNRKELQSKFRHSIHHFLRVNELEYSIFTAPSPSNQANLALVGHPLYKEWLKSKNGLFSKPPTKAFRREIYQQIICGEKDN